nr:MAG TPA: hypothetical protein [Bacteriophage sp.]
MTILFVTLLKYSFDIFKLTFIFIFKLIFILVLKK